MSFQWLASIRSRFCQLSVLVLTLCVVQSLVWAEGWREMNPDHSTATPTACVTEDGFRQGLMSGTILHIDIFDPAVETIRWQGHGTVEVFDHTGASIGTGGSATGLAEHTFTLTAADAIVPPAEPYDYELHLSLNQFEPDTGAPQPVNCFFPWDVSVLISAVEQPGRVWSHNWQVDAGRFLSEYQTNASFFGLVPAGEPDKFSVIELEFNGMAGNLYSVWGNSFGPSDENWVSRGRSLLWFQPGNDHNAVYEYPMYLNLPERVVGDIGYITPTITPDSFDFDGGQNDDVSCETMVSADDSYDGTFTFETNVIGTYHILCDLDDDGVGDRGSLVDPDDLALIGTTTAGVNTVVWDGLASDGSIIPIGDYSCFLRVTVGEFHYVGSDIETSYDGLRLFNRTELDGSVQSSMNMYWNDQLVVTCPDATNCIDQSPEGGPTKPAGTDRTVTTPGTNPTGAHFSPEGGLPSNPAYDANPFLLGDTLSDPASDPNARAWGDFRSSPSSPAETYSRGDMALMDTFSWVASDQTGNIIITIVSGTTDTDGEGLFDFEEDCIYGTDPTDRDTDGDTVNDYVETNDGTELPDTDEDGIDDPFDTDDDGDGVPTACEANSAGTVGDEPPFQNTDSGDGDTTPDYLDDDDDGDGVPTSTEAVVVGDSSETCPTYQNTDAASDTGDTIPDYLDVDDDGDGLNTEDEDVNENGDPTDDNTDSDDNPNYLDPDDDGDGVSTQDEDVDDNDDPRDDDTDGDDTPNYLDADDTDGPLADPDGDGLINSEDNCDYNANEYQEDMDEDGEGDACDDDIDGDQILNDDDNCDYIVNRGQENVDDDEYGDVCDDDIDGDLILNDDDNCPYDDNPGQEDMNDDGEGDACDPDIDGDGHLNADDNCPETANPLQEDENSDGIGDACQGDADGDGIVDVSDNCVDVVNADQADLDGDDIGDACDTDMDGDGLSNDDETNIYGTDPLDADTDNGGVNDGDEIQNGTDPLDYADDPGPIQLTGGTIFNCSAVGQRSGGAAMWLVLGLVLGLMVLPRRFQIRK